ncbi:MAG: hypothetical protein AAGF71_07555 [Pseudomonadota bacterium]
MTLVRNILGLALVAGLVFLVWKLHDDYNRYSNLARLTGIDELRPLTTWLREFKWPVIAVVTGLGLSLVSFIVRLVRLGH